MNLISGQARRELKRELSRLKSFIMWYWHFEYLDSVDIDRFATDHKIYYDTKEKIEQIEKQLKETK